jgi:hypothetical protein
MSFYYPKTHTVYGRNPQTFKMDEITHPRIEFAYLSGLEWIFTEKVDGTNIRIDIKPDGSVEYLGRTSRSQIPGRLLNVLKERVPEKVETLPLNEGLTLFGEGYGKKIQGGDRYGDTDFVLFDVVVRGEWASRSYVEWYGEIFGLDVVPIVGRGTLEDGVQLVKEGLRSTWGNFEAEGVIAETAVPLYNSAGNPIRCKIKGVDFE